MAADQKTFLDDPNSFKALVDSMAEPERSEYKSYGSLTLESAFPGRKMVVYTLQGEVPSDIDILTFGDLTVDWDTGPSFEVRDRNGVMQVMAVPKRIRPRDLFLQVPQNFILKYKGRTDGKSSVDFISHYAVLVKTRSNEIHQISGHTYCVTLNAFTERFPGLKPGIEKSYRVNLIARQGVAVCFPALHSRSLVPINQNNVLLTSLLADLT